MTARRDRGTGVTQIRDSIVETSRPSRDGGCGVALHGPEANPSAVPSPASWEIGPGCWWVLHTRARHEKAVAAALEKQQIAVYLPLLRAKRTYGRRVAWVDIPLFPNYLFLCGGQSECEAAWRTRSVANILRVADQQTFRNELQQIHRVVASGNPVDLYPALREGQRCRIIAGCLKGIEGVVVRRRSRSRIYIAVTMLGQSAVTEIDSALLEPVA